MIVQPFINSAASVHSIIIMPQRKQLPLVSFCSCSHRCKCGPGDWVKIGSLNPLDSCPSGFMSENIGGAQVCWKEEAGCTSFSFEAGQDYRAVCGVATAYAYGSPDAFGYNHTPDETIDEAYVDGISITYGSPRQHLFTYAATMTLDACPCKGGKPGPVFVNNNTYCGDQALAPGENWERKWYTNTVLWHAASDCSDDDITCRDDYRPWFSVQTASSTSDAVEIRSCQDQAYNDEALGIASMEIYIRVD